ncbi:alkaline ceramidase 3-like [Oscarella lobularis]|uniref:alkaline ceramidase 3-like n=1 Tax=Oscarella lobularis TaxID=121494 RepID=UPI003313AF08
MPPSYPDNGTGLWGKTTSTLDWCEENYAVTIYIAEFWNTITNIAFVLPSVVALARASKDKLESRYVLSHFLLVLVGVGSWSFHGTLLYSMQMLDELPMLFSACCFLYCTWTCNVSPGRTTRFAKAVTFFYALLTSCAYLRINEPLFHEAAYGFVVVLLVLHATYRARTIGCSARLYVVSIGGFAIGFFLWNLENQLCPSIRAMRDRLAWPLRPITQLHALWHLFTGIAAYVHILLSYSMRMKFLGHPTKIVHLAGILPILKPPTSWIETKEK